MTLSTDRCAHCEHWVNPRRRIIVYEKSPVIPRAIARHVLCSHRCHALWAADVVMETPRHGEAAARWVRRRSLSGDGKGVHA